MFKSFRITIFKDGAEGVFEWSFIDPIYLIEHRFHFWNLF